MVPDSLGQYITTLAQKGANTEPKGIRYIKRVGQLSFAVLVPLIGTDSEIQIIFYCWPKYITH